MKKILVTFAVLLGVILLLLVGCGEEKEEVTTATSEETTEREIITVPEMDLVLIQISSVEEYRKTVKQTEKFVQQENEIEILKENGFNIIDEKTIENYSLGNDKEQFYFPIVAKTNGEISIWYTTESGLVIRDDIYSEGNLHYDLSNNEDLLVIQKEMDFTLTYNESTGEIKKWVFNEVESTSTVPVNSYWAGHCARENHFFRSGSEVYKYTNSNASVRKIAYEVKEIVDCNYYYHHDKGMAPLFLMKNGNLKVYYEDKLQDICYEGGYHY